MQEKIKKFKQYQQLLIDVFGDNAKVAILYVIASRFYKTISKEKINFPLLHFHGGFASGKTSLVRSMYFLLEEKENIIILENIKDISTLLENKSNFINIDSFDEKSDYYWLTSGIKYFYTAFPLSVEGKKIVLTGHPPLATQGFLERCVSIPFPSELNTDYHKYEELRRFEKDNINPGFLDLFTGEESKVADNFLKIFNEYVRSLFVVPHLLFENYAILLAFQNIFSDLLIFDAKTYFKEIVDRQYISSY